MSKKAKAAELRIGNHLGSRRAETTGRAKPGAIDDFDRRWNPEVMLFESNAAFLGVKDLLVRHARYGPRVRWR